MLKNLLRKLLIIKDADFSSDSYWKNRYKRGGNSDAGSYGRLALFKAEYINGVIRRYKVADVIEFGYGDDNQLALFDAPRYLGYDISPECVGNNRKKYAGDSTKSFRPLDEYAGEKADLALSLDVIFHLVEDGVFHRYMETLFDAAGRFVCIYSSNDADLTDVAIHVRHRRFTDWIENNRGDWRLLNKTPNRYPQDPKNQNNTSFADFYLFTNDKELLAVTEASDAVSDETADAHRRMVRLQAAQHQMIDVVGGEATPPVLHAMHKKSYETAARLCAGKSVLEVGCNTGYGTAQIAATAGKVAAVDVSEEAIRIAVSRYKDLGIDFRQTDGCTLPFEDASFERVVSFQVLEHIVDTTLFLSEFKRVLTPDGVLLLATPNRTLRLRPGMKPWNRFHVREYDADELNALLANYFSHTAVLGLFADDEIYRYQREHFVKSREYQFYERIKRSLPVFSRAAHCADLLRHSLSGRLSKMMSRPFTPDELTADRFFYRTVTLNDSLDLLVVASNTDVKNAVQTIAPRN